MPDIPSTDSFLKLAEGQKLEILSEANILGPILSSYQLRSVFVCERPQNKQTKKTKQKRVRISGGGYSLRCWWMPVHKPVDHKASRGRSEEVLALPSSLGAVP